MALTKEVPEDDRGGSTYHWNADVMAGDFAAIMGHEETLRMEAMHVRTES